MDFASYQTAISGAAAAAELLELEREDTIRALEGFGGFSGRMKIERLGGRTVFDSSNSGLKVSDIERAMDKARGPNLVAVVGEDAQTVCEGLDIPRLAELLRRRRSEIEDLVLVGERLRPLARELGAETAQDLLAPKGCLVRLSVSGDNNGKRNAKFECTSSQAELNCGRFIHTARPGS